LPSAQERLVQMVSLRFESSGRILGKQ
jgi:hypothetical protein